MGDFTGDGEWLLKKWAIFFYCKIYASLNISIDGLHPTCICQLGVSRGSHSFCLGLELVKLVKNAWWTWPNNRNVYWLTKFTKCFWQVHQEQALNQSYEDLCQPLIDQKGDCNPSLLICSEV